MADPHLAALETTVVPENWSGPGDPPALDGTVTNGAWRATGPRRPPPDRHETGADRRRHGLAALPTRTSRSGSPRRPGPGCRRRPARRTRTVQDPAVAQQLTVDLPGEPSPSTRSSPCTPPRDRPSPIPLHAAVDAWSGRRLRRLLDPSRPRLGPALAPRRSTWTRGEAGRILRLHLFHVLQTLSRTPPTWTSACPPADCTARPTAGHVFWDELFVLPYLNLHFPEVTRALLRYRHRRLRAGPSRPGGRLPGRDVPVAERQRRPRGDPAAAPQPALGPLAARPPTSSATSARPSPTTSGSTTRPPATWSSCSQGRRDDAGDRPLLGRHRQLRPRADRYRIRGVMGPDEYHDGYPDARRTGPRRQRLHQRHGRLGAGRALETLEVLPEPRRTELPSERLWRGPRGARRWEDVSRTLHVCFHDGVISQFEGYGDLAELDWERLPAATATSGGSTGSWRPRATRSTATRPPSRPTS